MHIFNMYFEKMKDVNSIYIKKKTNSSFERIQYKNGKSEEKKINSYSVQ